jgi:hypothetical protein
VVDVHESAGDLGGDRWWLSMRESGGDLGGDLKMGWLLTMREWRGPRG